MIPVTLSKSLIELLTGGLPDFFSACEKAAQYLLSGFFFGSATVSASSRVSPSRNAKVVLMAAFDRDESIRTCVTQRWRLRTNFPKGSVAVQATRGRLRRA